MDFSTWSPSYTMIAIVVAVTFIGQLAILLFCIGRLGKRLNKQSDDIAISKMTQTPIEYLTHDNQDRPELRKSHNTI